MVIGPDVTNRPNPEDYAELTALLDAAFGRPDEAKLVERLREDGDMWQELEKSWEGAIVGYAALSRMRSPKGWACLAPVAVLPRAQNAALAPDEDHRRFYAIGTRLMKEIVLLVGDMSVKDFPRTVVVLGKTSFYERAGFSLSRAQKLKSPYSIDSTLIARAGDDVPEETLIYPRAFDELS